MYIYIYIYIYMYIYICGNYCHRKILLNNCSIKVFRIKTWLHIDKEFEMCIVVM